MKKAFIKYFICSLTILLSTHVFAGLQTFSGIFDGSENTSLANASSCGSDGDIYDLIGPFQVSITGDYEYGDISIDLGKPSLSQYLDIGIGVYSGIFDPNNTSTNQVNISDDSRTFTLTSGQNYYIVVQNYDCGNFIGSWMLSLIGSGNVTGTVLNDIENHFFTGEFNGTEQQIDAVQCGTDDYHHVFGPIAFADNGSYYYNDHGYNRDGAFNLDTYVSLYKGGFDPNNVSVNYLDTFDDTGEINLAAGNDYYIVVQPLSCGSNPTNQPYVIGFARGFDPALIPTLSMWSLLLLSILLIIVVLRHHKSRI